MPAGIGRRLRVDGEITGRGKVTSAVVLDQRRRRTGADAADHDDRRSRNPNLGTLLFGVRPIQLQLEHGGAAGARRR